VSTATVRGLILSTFAAIVAAPLARAELPVLQPFQTLEPRRQEVLPDPQGIPQSTLFAASLALDRNTLLSGMPGAVDSEGRVALFTRNGNGWARTGTLKASDAAQGARFGNRIALASGRALVASGTDVYVFALSGGVWRQRQKLAFDQPVQITDLGWNGLVALVGVGLNDLGTRSNAVDAFALNASGQLERIARFTAQDTVPGDLFGNRIAMSGESAVIAAPGYNVEQGAAYVFTCTPSGCVEQQKLIANDGRPRDHFGASVGLRGDVLVVGATNAIPTDQQENFATGAGYVFTRAGGTGPWAETQKLGATAAQVDTYRGLGFAVAVTGERVLLTATGLPGLSPAEVIVYDWSGGSLIPTHILRPVFSNFLYGTTLALEGSMAIAGTPEGIPPVGFADVYSLPPDMP
jgi:FG-GAP repeat